MLHVRRGRRRRRARCGRRARRARHAPAHTIWSKKVQSQYYIYFTSRVGT